MLFSIPIQRSKCAYLPHPLISVVLVKAVEAGRGAFEGDTPDTLGHGEDEVCILTKAILMHQSQTFLFS